MQSLIVLTCGMLCILIAMGFTPKLMLILFILVGVVSFAATIVLFILGLVGAVQLINYIWEKSNDKH